MNSYPDDLRELYFEFGRAAEMAQVMETEAGNLALVYASMLVDTSKITDEQREFFRALVQDVNKRTFGNLFREIQKLGQIDASILAAVNDALEKRNYLTHKFFRKHNFAIHSVDGRKAMLAEIREIQGSLSLAHAMLSGMTGSLSQLLAKLFGRKVLSEQEALALMARGKRVDI
jgi:hypothetical protein